MDTLIQTPTNPKRFGKSLNNIERQWRTLELTTAQFESGQAIIHVEGPWQFTKSGGLNDTEFYLLRQLQLEQDVRRTIESRASIVTLLARYGARYGELVQMAYPRHYAVRVLGPPSPALLRNIFMFLPWAAGVTTEDPRFLYGAEFTNAWAQVFDKVIFPAATEIFDRDTQLKMHSLLVDGVDHVCYEASLLHEVGHHCGAFAVIPHQHPGMHLRAGENTLFDAAGELTTDSAMVALATELPELAAFVALFRLLYFPRKGWLASAGANINDDNDALVGPLLWRIARRRGVITPVGDRYHLDFDALPEMFREVLDALDGLGNDLIGRAADNQAARADAWMRTMVDYDDASGRFVASQELSDLYWRLRHIPESDFVPPMGMRIY